MPNNSPRCQVVPLPRQEVSLEIDGESRMVWHGGPWAPRPFLYPLIGPSGHAVTRMGHPGAPDHDHHRSVWFAHAKVLGIDFWSDVTDARIRQKSWLVYEDGQQARVAVRLAWYDGHDPAELLEQDVFFTVLPLENRELLLDVQTTFIPAAEQLELGVTNFGFLAVRMAQHLSAHFGDGVILNSEQREGEPQIFGQSARWVDYSGSAPDNPHGVAREGISYLDHPDNVGYPSRWHVREDGWMGASLCMKNSLVLKRTDPLRLRYGLYLHGEPEPAKIEAIASEFNQLPLLGIRRGTKKHEQHEITENASRV